MAFSVIFPFVVFLLFFKPMSLIPNFSMEKLEGKDHREEGSAC